MISLFDLPESSHSIAHPDGRLAPTHIPPLAPIQAVKSSLALFRSRVPNVFAYHPSHGGSGSGSVSPTTEPYDGFNDPWFILLHVNIYTAEMMMWKEMAHHQAGAYETAVGCARALVAFIKCIRPDQWVHVGKSTSFLCPSPKLIHQIWESHSTFPSVHDSYSKSLNDYASLARYSPRPWLKQRRNRSDRH
jgi:hypothetical protein